MAKPRITSMLLYYIALLFSLFLATSPVEGRISSIGFPTIGVPLTCQSVIGVASGDTCFAVSRRFKLTDAEFRMINPNLDCDKLFVGQWLCVNGAV